MSAFLFAGCSINREIKEKVDKKEKLDADVKQFLRDMRDLDLEVQAKQIRTDSGDSVFGHEKNIAS